MALTADLATFRVVYPEFDAVPDARILFYIDKFVDDFSAIYWGDCLNEAILAITAHEIALSENRRANAQASSGGFVVTASGAGVVTQAAAGEINVSYAEPAVASSGDANDAYYQKTEYGQKFVALKRECLPRGIVSGCGAASGAGSVAPPIESGSQIVSNSFNPITDNLGNPIVTN